jgi:hypothetical protein
MLPIAFPLAMAIGWAAFPGAASAQRPDPVFRFFKVPTGETTTAAGYYAALPKTFSATGFYSDIASKTVGAGAYAFDINSPLWSDGAGKSRFLILPKDSVITYRNDSDEFRFPEGAVFVKHFWIDTIANLPATRKYIETRVLIRQEGQWHGLAYKWRPDQRDADLTGGPNDTAMVDSFTVTTAEGNRRMKKWLLPSRQGYSLRNIHYASCNSCHLNRANGRERSILGFILPQLTLAANGKDQIQDLIEKGYMVSGPSARYAAAAAHRWYALDDSVSPGSTLEKRARSYLASNCSHCHSPGGAASCIPVYTFYTPHDSMNYMNRKSTGPWGLDVPPGDTAKWIYPGRPELSTILRRISAADANGYRETALYDYPGIRRASVSPASAPGPLAKRAGWEGTGLVQMPPIATFEPNPLADRVIREWIQSLPPGYTGSVALEPHAGRRGYAQGRGAIRVRDGLIFVAETAPEAGEARLSDLRGRVIPLAAARAGVFLIPDGLQAGYYLLHVGGKRWPLAYFH